jgi:hypothetical protein
MLIETGEEWETENTTCTLGLLRKTYRKKVAQSGNHINQSNDSEAIATAL